MASWDEFIQSARIPIREDLNEEQLEDLMSALHGLLSDVASAIKKAGTPQGLQRLVRRFELRIGPVQFIGADLACVSSMLGQLAAFGDDWAKLEADAAPRLPVNTIASKGAELKEIDAERAKNLNLSEERQAETERLQTEAVSCQNELSSLREKRWQLWLGFCRRSGLFLLLM